MNTIEPTVSAARDFTRHLADLLSRERTAMVDLLLALVEFDGRRLWVELGYASLFDFLHRELKLSRSAAYYRNAAVALLHRYPEVAEALHENWSPRSRRIPCRRGVRSSRPSGSPVRPP